MNTFTLYNDVNDEVWQGFKTAKETVLGYIKNEVDNAISNKQSEIYGFYNIVETSDDDNLISNRLVFLEIAIEYERVSCGGSASYHSWNETDVSAGGVYIIGEEKFDYFL